MNFLKTFYFISSLVVLCSTADIAKKDFKDRRELSEDDMRIDDIMNELQGICVSRKTSQTVKQLKKDTQSILNNINIYKEVVKMNKKLREEIKWIIKESKGPKEAKRIIQLLKRDVEGICKSSVKAKDCTELRKKKQKKSGVYMIYPDKGRGFKVYCDMETEGGGWTVIQRRFDGTIAFNRVWNDYKKGFGSMDGEFWLGNDKISDLTTQGQYELRINLESRGSQNIYAKYSKFSVGDESTKYKLSVSGYSGTAGDSMSYHNNIPFSTKDRDNDSASFNCAVKSHGGGGWWYQHCAYSNLNGQYTSDGGSGIGWHRWKNSWSVNFKETTMMIRRLK